MAEEVNQSVSDTRHQSSFFALRDIRKPSVNYAYDPVPVPDDASSHKRPLSPAPAGAAVVMVNCGGECGDRLSCASASLVPYHFVRRC